MSDRSRLPDAAQSHLDQRMLRQHAFVDPKALLKGVNSSVKLPLANVRRNRSNVRACR